MVQALAVLKERRMLYQKDGATWFRATDFGDEKDRVVVRENGQKTYFASDIAYHYGKRVRGYDLLIDILGGLAFIAWRIVSGSRKAKSER